MHHDMVTYNTDCTVMHASLTNVHEHYTSQHKFILAAEYHTIRLGVVAEVASLVQTI